MIMGLAGVIELLFHGASSSSARRGPRLQRYFRQVTMYRQHIAAQYLNPATPRYRQILGYATALRVRQRSRRRRSRR